MKKKKEQKNLIIYQAKNGAIEFQGDFEHETIWATQLRISEVFGVDVRTINEHINNIYKTKELDKKLTVRKFRIVQKEGKRDVGREVMQYNLDMIISVGYRVNSKTATEFRKWATSVLKDYTIKGYTINRKQIVKNYDNFMQAVNSVQNLLPEHIKLDPKLVLELIKEFASTWVILDNYDKESLVSVGSSKKAVKLSAEELNKAILDFRSELIKKGDATELFAQERDVGSVKGIIGNILQSFGGKTVYATVEEKAAQLLYFMVKNHPFIDGNKRSGAFAFMWFLRKTKIKGVRNINSGTLTALTLLIAESNPTKKDQLVALVVTLLSLKK